jgi:hypothetical protein
VFKAISGLITVTTDGIPTTALPNGAIAIDTTNHVFYFRSNNLWNQVTGGGGASIEISDTPPAEPEEGDLWYESDTGSMFVYYDSAWIETGGGGGGGGGASIEVSDTAPIAPSEGDLWFDSSTGRSFIYYDSSWVELAGGTPSITSINDIGDVVITSPTEGQVLKYNGTNWINSTDNAGTTITSLDDIGDVSIGEPASGQFLKWSGSAWVNDAIDLGTDTTGNYVSDVTAGTGVTVTHTPGEGSNPTIAIGQAVGTGDAVTFDSVTSGKIRVGVTDTGEIDTTTGNLTIDSAGGTVTIDDNLVVTGDLTVSGTTTTLNTENLLVEDNIVVLNSGVTGSPTLNAGIEIERGTSVNVQLRWNETTDKWELTTDGTNYKAVTTDAYSDPRYGAILAMDVGV